MALELQNQERERISLNINSIEYKKMFICKIIYLILIRERKRYRVDRKINTHKCKIYIFFISKIVNFKYILNLFARYSFQFTRPKFEYQ